VEIPTYSIIIPAYNESARITTSLDKLLAHIAQERWSAEVLVVNDGSRDNTADIVRRYAGLNPNVRLVENPGNRGKGYSVRHGMLSATGDVFLFTDADLSAPIREASKLFAAIASGAEVAIASRWLQRELQTEKQPLYRRVFGRMFNFLLRVVLGLGYKDTQCGFKAFTRNAAMEIFPRQQIEGWGFDPELLFLAKKFNLRVQEVPVEWAHDAGSKINPLVDGLKMFMEILRIRWTDLRGRYKALPNRLVQSQTRTPESTEENYVRTVR
jgi:dolichyl-phosphate beta-glucosyltransferase